MSSLARRRQRSKADVCVDTSPTAPDTASEVPQLLSPTELLATVITLSVVIALHVLALVAVLMVPASEFSTCTMGDVDSWMITALIAVPLLLVISALLIPTKKIWWAKWFSLPQVVLVPWAAFVAIKYFIGVTVQGFHFCVVLGAHPETYPYSSWWAPYWAPVVLFSLLILVLSYMYLWRWKRGASATTL